MSRNAAFSIAVLLASATLASCSRVSLSRPRVAETLQKSSDFNQPRTVFIEAGKNLTIMTFEPEYPALKGLGLIDINGMPKIEENLMKGLDISLTEAGRRESRNWKREQHGESAYWTIPIANRQLKQIIGFRSLEEGKAEVEFAWSWLPNRTGAAIGVTVDSLTTEWEASMKRSEHEYADQFSHRRVSALERMQMDTLHMRLAEMDKYLFANAAAAKKVDGSRVFTTAVQFYRYDDGWHPSKKAGED
jgi:hypothetical protein